MVGQAFPAAGLGVAVYRVTVSYTHLLQKTFPPFPNASATLAQQHFQNGIGLHSGGHDDARRKGRHTGPDTAHVIANHDETASELPGGHRNAAPPGHAGGGNHTMPGQQQ